MKVCLRVFLGAALALGATTASAQAAGNDVVALQNGGRLRGTVMEYEPGVRVVIQMADGTTRTIAGAEVASVVFADAAAATAPTPQPTPPTSEPVAAAPSPPSEPAVERWSTAREFNAPRSDWSNESLALTRRTPQGDFHFGVQLEGGVMVPLSVSFDPGAAGVVGVFGFVEIPSGAFTTFRIGPAFSYSGGERFDGFVDVRGDTYASGARSLGMGGRLLFGSDLGHAFIRGGVEVLAIPDGSTIPLEATARVEFGFRSLPSRSLELGLAVAAGVTPTTTYYRTTMSTYQESRVGMLLPRVDLFAGWVFE